MNKQAENRLPGEAVAWSRRAANSVLKFTSWRPDQIEAQPLVPASDLEQVIQERDGAVAEFTDIMEDLFGYGIAHVPEPTLREGVLSDREIAAIIRFRAFLSNLDNRNG